MALVSSSPAQEIQTKPITRKFPQFTFCALPVDISFISPGTSVKVDFQALRFVDDGFGELLFTEQLIDNVMLATTAVHQANFGLPPVGSSLNECYNCGGVTTTAQYFYFNRFATLPFKETFDANPATRGWDMSHGATWNTFLTAPKNVEANSDFTGGSLLLGDAGPQPDPYATTSIEITGLTPGTSYSLSAWWSVGAVRCNLATPPVYLTITVSNATTGVGDPPLVQGSWLGPAIPNPTPSGTRIAYRLPAAGRVSVTIHDASGRRVRGLVSEEQPAGEHVAQWDGLDDAGRRAPSGLYFCRFDIAGQVRWRKVATTR
jgi:hypothetical protein